MNPSTPPSPNRGHGQRPSNLPTGYTDDRVHDHFRAGGSGSRSGVDGGGTRQLLDTAEYGLGDEYGQQRRASVPDLDYYSRYPSGGQQYPNSGPSYPLRHEDRGGRYGPVPPEGYGQPQEYAQQQQEHQSRAQQDHQSQQQQLQQQYFQPQRPHLQYPDSYGASLTRNSSGTASGSNSTSTSSLSTTISFASKRAEAATLSWGRRFWYAGDTPVGAGGGIGNSTSRDDEGEQGRTSNSRDDDKRERERDARMNEDEDDELGGQFGSGGGGGGGGVGRGNGHPDTRGKVLRFAVEIVQQPLHSRAFNDSRDRRPLVHPPIVRLRVVRCEPKQGMGGLLALVKDWENLMEDDTLWDDRFDELDADILSLDPSGLVCTLDLISYRDVEQQASSSATDSASYRLANRIPVSWTMSGGSRTGPRRGSTSQASLRGSATIRAATSAAAAAAGSRSLSAPEELNLYRGGDQGVISSRPSSSSLASVVQESSRSPEADNANKRRKIAAPSGSGGQAQSTDGTPVSQYAPVFTSDRGGDGDRVSMQQVDGESEEATVKNLYGNLHLGGRRMYGPRSDDREGSTQGASSDRKDLGIWFILSDVSIRTQGEYAIRFRCSDLNTARTSPSPPSQYFTSRLPDASVAAQELLALGISIGENVALQELSDDRGGHQSASIQALAEDDRHSGDLAHRIAQAVPKSLGNKIAEALPLSMTGGLPDGLGIEHAIRSDTGSDSPEGKSDTDSTAGLGQDEKRGDGREQQVPQQTPPPRPSVKFPRAPFLGEAFSRSFKVFYGRSCPPVPAQTKLTEHFTR